MSGSSLEALKEEHRFKKDGLIHFQMIIQYLISIAIKSFAQLVIGLYLKTPYNLIRCLIEAHNEKSCNQVEFDKASRPAFGLVIFYSS